VRASHAVRKEAFLTSDRPPLHALTPGSPALNAVWPTLDRMLVVKVRSEGIGEESPCLRIGSFPCPCDRMPAEPGPSLRARGLRVAAPAVASTCDDTTSPAATVTLKARLCLGRVPQ
jgi:hypothetical protein